MSPDSQAGPERRPPRGRRVDAERNRTALLEAARAVFDEQGVDAALDVIARRAGVANATLYRHFPTRADLLVAVYAEEVDDLARLADRLLADADAGAALTEWLRAFARHVATKRDLAQATPDGQRGALFAAWHDTMHNAATRLLERAADLGAVRAGIDARDLLAVVGGAASAGRPDLDPLLRLVQDGYRP